MSEEALFLNHAESLKSKFIGYNINPFGERPVKDITTGKELDKSIVRDLIRKYRFIEFAEEQLVNGIFDLLSPINKGSINIALKKSVITLIKENRQAFGNPLSNNADLAEVFKYPTAAVSLSITAADKKLQITSAF